MARALWNGAYAQNLWRDLWAERGLDRAVTCPLFRRAPSPRAPTPVGGRRTDGRTGFIHISTAPTTSATSSIKTL